MRMVFWALALLLLALPAAAQVRLQVSEILQETGLLKHIVPRFSLKTSVRVELVPQDGDLRLSSVGDAVSYTHLTLPTKA